MITSSEIKEQFTDNNIIDLLRLLGCTYIKNNDSCVICNTICHHGASHKLYYYKNQKIFKCYTECGTMDIFALVQNSLGIDFYNSFLWIESNFNINQKNKYPLISDWNFIKRKTKNDKFENLEVYDNKILNIFQNKYYLDWINEGISVKTMIKYGIKYCDYTQQIIIPHYNITNKLVGIRARNLVNCENGKYMPFYDGKRLYNHSLGNNLFGLNLNKKAITNKRKVMVVEGEKSVMQCDDMFGENNFSVALCGSHISDYQIRLLLNLNVNEIILALDKQFQKDGDEECVKWKKHIFSMAQKISIYCKVSILWDDFNLLSYKDSPTDKGKEILLKLLDNKIRF